MGINMDIRNEPKFSFLDLYGLDEAGKNEIAEILRLDSSVPSLKLPWAIGEKEYEINNEIMENPAEDATNQWPPYGITSYEIYPRMTPHAYPQMIGYAMSDYQVVGNPYGNNAAGDPNAYSFVQRVPYGTPAGMYSPNQADLMNQGPPSRESDRRGPRNRGGKRGDTYSRQMNTNNEMQPSYMVPSQPQYSQMMPICHPSGPMFPVPAASHPAAGTRIFIQQNPPSNYSQGPPMHHNSHASYAHHQSSYPSHSHSSNSAKHVRNSTGQTTYYNPESPKILHKQHHEKRGNQQHDIPPPPFRHSSVTNNNNSEAEPLKRNYGKTFVVNNSNANIDTINNSVKVSAQKLDIKKITISDPKTEITEALAVKPDDNENKREKKEALSTTASNIHTNVISPTVKDKPVVQEKEVSMAREEKAVPVKAPSVEVSTKVNKIIENLPEPNQAIASMTKNVPEPVTKSVDNVAVTTAAPTTPLASSISTAQKYLSAPTQTFASVLRKPGTTTGDMKSPTPITKLPIAGVHPMNFPPPSAEAVTTKISTPEPLPKSNDNGASITNRNNVEPATKVAEPSAWADNKTANETPQNSLNDPAVFRMGELLLKYQMDKQTVSLLPRGLTNRSNYCYINSILQALLACPPFYNLLMALPHPRGTMKNSSTPLIDNMVRFVHEFNPLSDSARMPRKDKSQKRGDESANDVQCGIAFEPSYVYTMLKNTSCAGGFSVEGRQEDAEEFLSCLLNGISDEMLELMKLVNTESNDNTSNSAESNVNFSNTEEEWKVMGPKNKGSITRCTEFARTPLSDIFRGQLRSRVLRTGDETTDNVQPFFTLQLDIEKAESVEAALEILVGKDQVEGMTCSKTKQQIEAWKQVLLEELPIILILHLKWFDYKLDGCSKIFKRVGFPIDLKLDGKLLAPNASKKLARKQKQYKLFAVTYHDGKEATKGHYVTDAFHVGYNSWVRYDDSSVKGINEENLLNPSPPRVPYLLYYRRCDTIGNNPSITTRTR